jgi:hypothetical protein
MKRVFLGGTCNGSTWRDKLIPMLDIEYFNPVVDDWNEEARLEELTQRNECDFVLYVITPEIKGVYSIAEVIDDSNKRPWKTIFAILLEDTELFDPQMLHSLYATADMVKMNLGSVFYSLECVADYLNEQA